MLGTLHLETLSGLDQSDDKKVTMTRFLQGVRGKVLQKPARQPYWVPHLDNKGKVAKRKENARVITADHTSTTRSRLPRNTERRGSKWTIIAQSKQHPLSCWGLHVDIKREVSKEH
jgi:hypothetical protein